MGSTVNSCPPVLPSHVGKPRVYYKVQEEGCSNIKPMSRPRSSNSLLGESLPDIHKIVFSAESIPQRLQVLSGKPRRSETGCW